MNRGDGFSLVALVPMRHRSERVPGKNYRPLAGKPLYAYILETLESVEGIEQIVVDTDSDVIKEGVAETFPEIAILDRPPELRGGEVPMNAVLLHDVREVESRFYLQTHSTNPLLRVSTIQGAIDRFLDEYPERDSLFGVTRLQTRLWSAEGEALNHDPTELLRTQDLEPVFEENSCLYLFDREGFLQRENRIGPDPVLFEIDLREAWDIDEERDFDVVDCLVRRGLHE